MGQAAPPSSSSPLAATVRASGLVDQGAGVALCSGGADSAGLAAGLVGACGPDRVVGLHLDYGLRPDSGEDAAACDSLCRGLGIEVIAQRPELPEGGNVQAKAREARYAAAERLRAERGLDWIATGHTRTDLAETFIYRLATSPGRRALLGLPERRGALVRPLLGASRSEVRAWVRAAGLPFRDDPTNAEPLYARNRIRSEVLPVLGEIGPAAEATIAETRAELAEEATVLERLAAEALAATGADVAGAVPSADLERLDPALARLALRALAERAAGGPVALGRERAAEIRRLAADPEGGVVELGGGLVAHAEHGHVRFTAGSIAAPHEATLAVPGSCRFGEWEVRAEIAGRGATPAGPGSARLDRSALGPELIVRAWRDGDRIRPIGLGGSKSLQDLFTDRKVPRSLRRTLPVVASGERIAWIAGLAVSEEFAAIEGSPDAAVLTATIP